jgi:hypothetical protein
LHRREQTALVQVHEVVGGSVGVRCRKPVWRYRYEAWLIALGGKSNGPPGKDFMGKDFRSKEIE